MIHNRMQAILQNIFLPWPPRELSPNARVHRLAKARIARIYRQDCYLLAKTSGVHLPPGRHPVKILFCPPDKKRRDLDNCLASIKAGLDGVAEALGVDDRLFRPVTIDFGETTGRVLVQFD
jgi:crossover junction endodeoxyribonuclease RusA